MKIKEITSYLESIAPLALQEDYDNSGLIVGDEETIVKSILIALDCTESVIDEAIQRGCNLIITHHPIIFNGLKKLNGNSHIERTVIKSIRNEIAIYSIHTNLDNIEHGVNSKIAERLGIQNTRILRPKVGQLRQLVFYCPSQYASKLRKELFIQGAGNIGSYDQCSFSFSGRGTFRASIESTPFVGEVGKSHDQEEECISLVYPKYIERDIIDKLKEIHPYEEVAYQLYTLDNVYPNIGSGLVGDLPEEILVSEFLNRLKEQMNTECIRYTDIGSKNIRKVAICGGSGSFLLDDAKSVGADIFITSDFKYHEFFHAEGEIIIADIGHYESEQFTNELIYDLLKEKFPKFAVQLSKLNTNPIKYI